MNGLPVSILYSRDATLAQRLRGYLLERSDLLHVSEATELRLLLRQHPAVLLFMDLCGTSSTALLPDLRREHPATMIIALGDARSDPGLMAAGADLFCVESPDADRLRVQSLFDQAQMQLKLRTENRMLRENLQQPVIPTEPSRQRIVPSLYHFAGALRRFDNIESMLENIVEGVADCTRVSRVAIISVTATGVYGFRAGVKCMEHTRTLAFSPSHPFVQWLQIHAHSISRSMLRHSESLEERSLLEQQLNLHGAEVMVPLFGRERLIGWLCLGRPSSGIPFDQREIEDLTLLAEQISVTIENALLHDSIAMQKALAENLLQAIPVGIIAAGHDGTIRWFNSGAEQLLNTTARKLIGRPVEGLAGTIASLLNRCIAGEKEVGPVEWTEPHTRRELSVHARHLQQNGLGMGAMAVLTDLTEERLLREKQNNLERAQFWNELASAISHEVRNPLVAISTFAQLLPERYADEEFRTQFRDLTTQEVERLNAITDQLDLFANPPTLRFGPVDAHTLLNTALCKAQTSTGADLDVSINAASDLPFLRADAEVLADCIAHLLDNACAAVEATPQPRIALNAARGEIGSGRPAIVIEVRDNGHGIPDALLEKIFSPFCTTKTRGVGLGLSIVRRTVIDHEGLVSIDSTPSGTVVRLTIPALDAERGGFPS
jgi:nitrogen-specific signal transduction histidine kinase